MLTETNLPCSDCGGELAELVVDVRSLPGPRTEGDSHPIAFCPDCQIRFYPKQTLEHLFPTNPPYTDGDV